MGLGLRGAVFLLGGTWGNQVSPPGLDLGQGFTGIGPAAWLLKRWVCGTGGGPDPQIPPQVQPWGAEGEDGVGEQQEKWCQVLGGVGGGSGMGVLGGVQCCVSLGGSREGGVGY